MGTNDPTRPPVPAELRHLQPQNARGAALVLVCVALTATGVWLSLRPGAAAVGRRTGPHCSGAAPLVRPPARVRSRNAVSLAPLASRRRPRRRRAVADSVRVVDAGARETSQVDRLARPRPDRSSARTQGAIESVAGNRQRVLAIVDSALLVRLPRRKLLERSPADAPLPISAASSARSGRAFSPSWRPTPPR